jgi:hypothetical protein
MQTYREPTYDDRFARTVARFPNAAILSARELFTSNRDWRDRWPLILPTVDALVFIADCDGWIGRGVHTEILDAASLAIPVEFVAPDGGFHPLRSVEFLAVGMRGWRQYARIRVRSPRARRAR